MLEEHLINESINKLRLNLADLIIFTEAASNHYKWTPIIAALAGAKKVFAIAKDSQFGPKQEIQKEIMKWAQYLKVNNKINITFHYDNIGEADIITNLGFVRPLNASIVNHLKSTSVIALMRETWEFREEDLDLAECNKRGILVVGTNENDHRIRIFDYIGPLALKLLLQNEIALINSKILVIGNDIFASKIKECLSYFSKNVSRYAMLNARIPLEKYHVIIFAERERGELLAGRKGPLSFSNIAKRNPDIKIIHISGNVDCDELKRSALDYFPKHIMPFGYMSCNLDYLGPQPVIDLHAAGLKVGEIAARERLKKLSLREIRAKLLTHSLIQLLTID